MLMSNSRVYKESIFREIYQLRIMPVMLTSGY